MVVVNVHAMPRCAFTRCGTAADHVNQVYSEVDMLMAKLVLRHR